MRKQGLRGEFWPSPVEERALLAALAPEDMAAASWHELGRRVHGGDLVDLIGRLAPLLYKRLGSLGIDDPAVPRLKGIYRRSWFMNNLLIDGLGAVMRALADAGITALAVKGAAVIPIAYDDPALRPMNDVDVLIPHGTVVAALNALASNGWTGPQIDARRLERYQQAAVIRDARGRECDLHWQLSTDLTSAKAPHSSTDTVFAHATTARLAGESLPVPDPADVLLHTVLHGVSPNMTSRIQWIADAWLILDRLPDGLDWERLLALADDRHAVPQLADAFAYLSRHLHAPVPPHVVGELRSLERSGLDRFLIGVLGRRRRPVQGTLLYALRGYARMNADRGVGRTVLGLPRFFQMRWGLEHVRDVPTRAARKARTKVARVLSRR